MLAEQITVPSISVPPDLPVELPPPRYQLNQTLKFSKVPSADFGRIAGIVYAAEANYKVRRPEYFYLLIFDPESKSRREGVALCDWVAESDAELVVAESSSNSNGSN